MLDRVRKPVVEDSPAAVSERILRCGRNVWRAAPARKAAVLVDAANYYARLEQALAQARRSILIIGWDFDGRIKLCPDRADCLPLGEFLRSLVELRPQLEIRILVWSVAVLHAPSAPGPLLVGAPWQEHPRISLRLDRQHPLYAAHHQKLVCIDDALAFAGGMDLTVRRWDTCGHSASDGHRVDPLGAGYAPVHDVQMAIEGRAARHLAALARERWRVATGETLAPVPERFEIWPADLDPDFADVAVAIARTLPGFGQQDPIAEVSTLTADMLAAARHSVYIETQYFTASRVGDLIEKSLAASKGPEIVVLVTRSESGTVERFVMGNNCDRLVRRLRNADRHDRLRVCYPVIPGPCGMCKIHVHSKVMIVDDCVLRVGSANLNNRSQGLDTECDLVIEAHDDWTRRGIARIRERLLAEHLAVTEEAVAGAIAEHGSLIRAIARLNRNPRGLRPLPEKRIGGPTRPVIGTAIFDPPRPFGTRWWQRRRSSRPSLSAAKI